MIVWGWASVRADFARFYRMDLRACGRDLTWHRFALLLKHLPGDSAWGAFLKDSKRRSLVDLGREGRVL